MAKTKTGRGQFTSETARENALLGWEKNPAGLDGYIERLVKRAPALSDEQLDKLRAILQRREQR